MSRVDYERLSQAVRALGAGAAGRSAEEARETVNMLREVVDRRLAINQTPDFETYASTGGIMVRGQRGRYGLNIIHYEILATNHRRHNDTEL